MQDQRAKHKSTRTESVAESFRALDGAVWRDWRERGDKDPAFLAKLVAMFVHDADQRLAAISAALTNGNASECARAAHALAAGCLQLGATGLAKHCLDIERTAQCGKTDLAPQLMQRVRDEYRLVKQELEAAVASTKTGSENN